MTEKMKGRGRIRWNDGKTEKMKGRGKSPSVPLY